MEINAFQVAVYHEHVIVVFLVCFVRSLLQAETLCALCHIVADDILVFLLQLKIFLYHCVHVKLTFGNLLVEVADLLESQFLYQACHHRLF